MISQTEFDRVASEILRDVNAMMTKMQTYKKHLQYEVLKYAYSQPATAKLLICRKKTSFGVSNFSFLRGLRLILC